MGELILLVLFFNNPLNYINQKYIGQPRLKLSTHEGWIRVCALGSAGEILRVRGLEQTPNQYV